MANGYPRAGMDIASDQLVALMNSLPGGGAGSQDQLWRRHPQVAAMLEAARMQSQDRGLDREHEFGLRSAEWLNRTQEAERGRQHQGTLTREGWQFQGSQSEADRKAQFDALSAELLARKAEGEDSRSHATTMQQGSLGGQKDIATIQANAAKYGVDKEAEMKAKFSLTPEQAMQQAQAKAMFDARAGILGNPDIADPNERLATLDSIAGGMLSGQVKPMAPVSSPHPSLAGAIETGAKSGDLNQFFDAFSNSAMYDSPAERQKISTAMKQSLGPAELALLDTAPKSDALFSRAGTALKSRNVQRLKAGLPPLTRHGGPLTLKDIATVLPPDVPLALYRNEPWYQKAFLAELPTEPAPEPRAPKRK